MADFLEIANGFGFCIRKLTIEFWAAEMLWVHRQSILSQGIDA